MQVTKPRAIFVPETNEWIVTGRGIVRIRPCLDAAVRSWYVRLLESVTTKHKH